MVRFITIYNLEFVYYWTDCFSKSSCPFFFFFFYMYNGITATHHALALLFFLFFLPFLSDDVTFVHSLVVQDRDKKTGKELIMYWPRLVRNFPIGWTYYYHYPCAIARAPYYLWAYAKLKISFPETTRLGRFEVFFLLNWQEGKKKKIFFKNLMGDWISDFGIWNESFFFFLSLLFSGDDVQRNYFFH